VADYITVADLKTNMGITSSDYDALLLSAIGAASESINSYCGRTFDAATGTETAKVFYVDDPGEIVTGDFIISDAGALVVADDANGDGTFENTWTADSLTATRSFEAWPRQPEAGWPYRRVVTINGSFPTGPRRVQVTADWGWTATPDAIIMACQLAARRIAIPLLADAGADVAGVVKSVKLEGSDAVVYSDGVAGAGGVLHAPRAGALSIEAIALIEKYRTSEVIAVGQEDLRRVTTPDTVGGAV